MPVARKKASNEVEIKPVSVKTVRIPIMGISNLINEKFSDKSLRQMEEKQQGKAKGAKDKRKPEEDYEASMYKDDNGNFAMPSRNFKAAMVNACRFVDGIPMTKARGAFFVKGEWTQIFGDSPRMRTDPVRNANGVADIRYRAEFVNWWSVLEIEYMPSIVSAEQLVHLVNTAGFSCGVGGWRPQKSDSGWAGRFRVVTAEDLPSLGLSPDGFQVDTGVPVSQDAVAEGAVEQERIAAKSA